MSDADVISTSVALPRGLERTLPVALLVSGRRCLVVGAGRVGEQKVAALRAADAVVHVVAPTATSGLRERAERDDHLTWSARAFHASDLDDVVLVITATGVPAIDGTVYEAARERTLPVNSADDPRHCTFYLTSVVRRDPVTVAISTAGASPALASYLRRRLDHVLEAELAPLAVLLHERRVALHDVGQSTEHLDWASVVTDELVALAVAGDWDEVRRRVDATGRVTP